MRLQVLIGTLCLSFLVATALSNSTGVVAVPVVLAAVLGGSALFQAGGYSDRVHRR
jgi:hypothetical protein